MKQRHRIFIAINLPENIKKKLVEYQKKWPELPVRWTKPDSLHITLAFLGYLKDEELVEICKITREVASRHTSFEVRLNKISYGPNGKKPPRPPKFSETVTSEEDNNGLRKFGRPRMIWAAGEKSEEFTALKNDLDKLLASSEGRQFSLHITLGRIRQWEWRRIEPEDRPEVEEEIDLLFPVNSIEIMESVLKRGGPKYNIIESINLV